MQVRCIKAEYIWLDGAEPVQQLRSKSKIIALDANNNQPVSLEMFTEWGFDGSSTYQATGHDSDLTLVPSAVYRDPLRGGESYFVLCEVNTPDNRPHSSNSRAHLRALLAQCKTSHDPWAGFEQEYTMLDTEGRPFGADTHKFMRPQGPFYCSVGADVAFGRMIVEEHMDACLNAGLMIYGTNGEVMPGQWEFQIGYRDNPNENSGILEMADQLWIARHMLQMIGEKHGVVITFNVKPVKGDWNGAGMHTNFSTIQTREKGRGGAAIEQAVNALSQRHQAHIAKYGYGNQDRLTGKHETCDINTFRSGIADRGCSIRIPRSVSKHGCGYLEDRRPGANANPYDVAAMLVETICIGTN
jgi:glutamine synthetase